VHPNPEFAKANDSERASNSGTLSILEWIAETSR